MAPPAGTDATSTQTPLMGSSLPGSSCPVVIDSGSRGSDRGGVGAVPPAGGGIGRMVSAQVGNRRYEEALHLAFDGVTGISGQGEL